MYEGGPHTGTGISQDARDQADVLYVFIHETFFKIISSI